MILSVQITDAQLLISGLASGIAVVGVVIRWLVTSPEREAAAYRAGLSDEQARCAEDINELREQYTIQAAEVTKLRNALLRLAIASDLTSTQRAEIAHTLGFSKSVMSTKDPPLTD